MAADPTDDELIRFAESLLGDLGAHLREPSVLADSVRDHRHLWVTLFQLTEEMADIGNVGRDRQSQQSQAGGESA